MVAGVSLLCAVLFVLLFTTYNKLNTNQKLAIGAWAAIQEHLTERAKIGLTIVELVRPYEEGESQLFFKLTELRAQAKHQHDPAGRAELETQFTAGIKSLLALADLHSEIKDNDQFFELLQRLQAVENQITASKRYYNGLVLDSNSLMGSFPSSVIAKGFGFTPYQKFEP